MGSVSGPGSVLDQFQGEKTVLESGVNPGIRGPRLGVSPGNRRSEISPRVREIKSAQR